MKLNDEKLYVIIDIPMLNRINREPETVIRRAFDCGARLFQLRHKSILDGQLCDEAGRLCIFAHEVGAKFIVNDSVSVALAIDADGVHLGEDDLPISKARKIMGDDFFIGASASSMDIATKAEKASADYIGYGAMFETSTKSDTTHGSFEELERIIDCIQIPVFPLGGINLKNIGKIIDTGCYRACVSSAIIMSENPGETVSKILDILQ